MKLNGFSYSKCQERTIYTRSCLVMCIWLWQRCRSRKLYLSYHVVLCSTAPPGVCCCVLLLVMYVAMHVRSCGLCVAISATTMVCSYFCTVATSALLRLCCVWGYINSDTHVSLLSMLILCFEILVNGRVLNK